MGPTLRPGIATACRNDESTDLHPIASFGYAAINKVYKAREGRSNLLTLPRMRSKFAPTVLMLQTAAVLVSISLVAPAKAGPAMANTVMSGAATNAPAMTRPRVSTTELIQAAELGDAHAQYKVGMMSLIGELPASTSADAVRWFRRAADQGLPEAERIIGNLYAEGIGVPQNDAATIKWYRLAAEQGDAVAQFYLGHIFTYSLANQNVTEAMKWYRLAAAQGHVRGQLELAHMYTYGIGTEKNLIKAYVWNAAASSQLQAMQASAAASGEQMSYRINGLAYRGPSPVPHATELLNSMASKMSIGELSDAKVAAERCQTSRFRDCD